jgi:integrase
MLLLAAHTGARRSEMLRARVEDVDLGSAAATIRDKKRVKGRLTTRRVPLSTALAAELAPLVVPGRAYLFGDGSKPISVQAAQKAFSRAMRGSRWAVMLGYHVLRHSCASALAHKNVDQRVIDQIIGHSSAEMSRRYRHIRPDTAGEAVASVFG